MRPPVDELEEGLAGISVGLSRADGELLAVVNVSGPTQRLDAARLAEAAREAAAVTDGMRRQLMPRGR